MSADNFVFDIEVPVGGGRTAVRRLTPVNLERHLPLFVRGHAVNTYQMHDVESNSLYVHPELQVSTFHFTSSPGLQDGAGLYNMARARFQSSINNLAELTPQYLKRVARSNVGTLVVDDYQIVEPWMIQRYALHGNSPTLLESKLRYRVQPATGPVRYTYEQDSFIERNHRFTVTNAALDHIVDDFKRRQEAILQRVRGK